MKEGKDDRRKEMMCGKKENPKEKREDGSWNYRGINQTERCHPKKKRDGNIVEKNYNK